MAIKTYNKGTSVKLSTNFKSNEFDCHGSKCCSTTKIDETLVKYLQKIRDHFGKSVKISSGYRCATHNKKVGGATASLHAKGQAADIYITGVKPSEIAKYAESIGILGIGLYETDKDGHFVHIDTRTTKSFWYGQAQAKRTTFGGSTTSTSKSETKATFTNSPLVDYTKISPNRTKNRNHAIDTITIHCVVGQLSVETIGDIFAPTSRKASCNYGVGTDGRIGMYVEEKDRSWCSSSAENDHRAITIEVACDLKAPYTVNSKAYNALIKLLVDICKRNNIKELKWKGDKSLIGQVDKQNMTVHRWFSNTECPGDYLYSRQGQIAEEVNKQLNGFPYLVKITANTLNVRNGAGTNYSIKTTVKKNEVYTIVDAKDGWGKLKAGGWISLKYTSRI